MCGPPAAPLAHWRCACSCVRFPSDQALKRHASGLVCGLRSERQPRHYIDSIYMGQGDATLLVSDGEAALIDTGDEYQARKLIGYLKREGIATLKWVLITHHHPDH